MVSVVRNLSTVWSVCRYSGQANHACCVYSGKYRW